MSVVPLPPEPSLEQLKKLAREHQRAARSEHPDEPFTLHDAQRAIARRHGFPSWTALKRHVEVVERHTRRPDEAEPSSGADELLRLGCLTYGDDSTARRDAARTLLAADPSLATATIWTAAATASVDAVRRFLSADTTLATADGGPFRWRPLAYLAYARLDDEVPEEDVLAATRALLDAGADPDDGYLWHGLASPFTLLTGAFGGGEQGWVAQPPHPRSLALARTLLEAGADPNDAQALYNRIFFPVDDHLELLFAFGLGTGDGGPWRRRLGHALPTPTDLLHTQLWWAVGHHQHDRVRLLLGHGADLARPFEDGRSPTELARITGDEEMVTLLVEAGAAPPRLDAIDDLVAAVIAGDASRADALVAADPPLLGRTIRERPAVVLRAAVDGGEDAVRLAVRLGFDVNALGRADTWRPDPWQTALHRAAEANDPALAAVLLSLGADPSIRDARFDATAADWADHFGHTAAAEALRSP
jgi:ankyrin repeat protein